jgi:hypothetical protein
MPAGSISECERYAAELSALPEVSRVDVKIEPHIGTYSKGKRI